MRRIRVLIVDDHPIVRAGIAASLRDCGDIEVVGEAASGPEAVSFVLGAEEPVDVILMDLRMPGGGGAAATAALSAAGSSARVLILTTYENDDDILAAIEAGASGYLLKAAPQDEILSGIRSVASGGAILGPEIASLLVSKLQTPVVPDTPVVTARELDVLRAVADGKTNGQIASLLCISEATVKTHLVRAFEKLGVGDRTSAVLRAIDSGMLDR